MAQLEDPRRVEFSGRDGGFGRVECANQRDRLAARLRDGGWTLRLDSARPSRLANDRSADDLDVESEIANHAADHAQLLVVLLAEDGEVGLRGEQEFRDDRRDRAEMARTRSPAERPGGLPHLDPGLTLGRDHLVALGCEDHVDTRIATVPQIDFARARVIAQVRGVFELGRVDEDRNPDAVGPLARLVDERQVAGVERTHRGHQRDLRARGALAVRERAKLRNRFDDTHAGYRYECLASGNFELATSSAKFRAACEASQPRFTYCLTKLGVQSVRPSMSCITRT